MGGRRTSEDQGLIESFFGEDGKKSLKLNQFAKFLQDLHTELVRLEFVHYAGSMQVNQPHMQLPPPASRYWDRAVALTAQSC